ncbi:MAG: hypothetical protein RR240_04175 [Burkholderiaceae bacterium]
MKRDAPRQRIEAVARDPYVPAYTNGVQVMLISYAHYLLADVDCNGSKPTFS